MATTRNILAITSLIILLAVTSAATADYEEDVLALSPIAYWRLNETSGNTADNLGSLGAAADGAFTDAVTLGVAGLSGAGIGNTAIHVGPDDGSVRTGSSFLSNRSSFTVSAFIKPTDLSGSRIGIVGQNNAIEFGLIDPGTLQVWTPPTEELDVDWDHDVDEWHHVAATGDGDELRIYIDGELEGTLDRSVGNYGSSGDGVNIGGGGVFDDEDNQFTGAIDEVAIFDRALSDAQIRTLAEPATRVFQVNPGVNDAWFNAATAGQGFFIIVFEDTGIVFLSWFTFDTMLPPEDVEAFLGAAEHRWLTAQGPWDEDTVVLDVFLTEGGLFDMAEPQAMTGQEPIGTITITWHDCGSATLTYDIDPPGVVGEIKLRRIVPDNVALCQTLDGGYVPE